MALNTDSTPARADRRVPNEPEKFSVSLAKFAGKIIGAAVVGIGLILLGNQFGGVLKWVFIIAGVALLAGMALYSSALSGEVRRKLGPLPLGKPGEDLKSMPLYQGRGALGDTKPTSTT